MFDCVIPTRAGRTARAYTSGGVLNLRNARFLDARPLDPGCHCPALHSGISRLSASSVPGGGDARAHAADLAQPDLLPGPDAGMRAAIAEGRLAAYADATRAGWDAEDE